MLAYVLIVVTIAIAVSSLAEKRNYQPALLVVMVGLVASFLPGIPRLDMPPEVVLTLVLPPMLFSAARDFSFAEFRRRMGSIANLGILLVAVSTLFVGAAAWAALPALVPIAALILGVVIAPPDAVTAISIGRRSGLPANLMTVLKGESLINDAAALTIFAILVATASGTHAFIDNIPLYFLYAAGVGVLVGLVIGNLAQLAHRVLSSPALATALTVVVPFAAYLTAEELHASGVLAVVMAGFTVGHFGVQAGYEERMQESAFWRTVDTLLETFIFAYIGLQLRFVITDAGEAGFTIGELLLATAAIFVATVAIRFAWVFGSAAIGRWRYNRVMHRMAQGPIPERRGRRPRLPQRPLTNRENLVLAWTGMRGVVTLAAASGVPFVTATGEDFPGRSTILALAFLVTIATLLIQGLTLPLLIARLDLEDGSHDQFVERQREKAQKLIVEATNAALDAYLETHSEPDAVRMVDLMRKRMQMEAGMEEQQARRGFAPGKALELGKMLLETRRSRLVEARDRMELDDTTVRDMLEKLDLEQAFMDSVTETERPASR